MKDASNPQPESDSGGGRLFLLCAGQGVPASTAGESAWWGTETAGD